jgi:3',5'-cyclic AMP phosphodiesterase CpdA
MSTSSNAIVWLHLSDLHLCEPKTGWDAHSVLDPLIEDLKTMEAEHGLLPQLLFFTGDAAFGSVAGASLADQYQDVETFLAGVRGAFSQAIPKDNVFLVPGNHDVDRGEVTDDQNLWLDQQTDVKKITQRIQEGKKDWRQYMDRLATYRQFLETNGYDHLLTDPGRLLYAQVREIHGVKIGIGGFNSAWSCGRNGEKSKLWLGGDWQTGTIVNQLKKQQADLKMALIHHPPGWFVEQEDNQLRSRTERDFDFFLHGHEHQGWVNNINDKLVRIAGAACYEGSGEENGYNLVRLNLDTGTMEIWLRKFDNDGGGWIPRIIAKKTDNHGLWKLNSLTCLSSFKGNRINQAQPMATILHTVNVENMSAGDTTASPDIKKAKPINLFYSYAHEDENYRNQLEKHLSTLKRQGIT